MKQNEELDMSRIKNVSPLDETTRITAIAQTIEYVAVRETFEKVVEVLNKTLNNSTENIKTVHIQRNFVGVDILFNKCIYATTLRKILEIPNVSWMDITDGYLSIQISGDHGHKENKKID